MLRKSLIMSAKRLFDIGLSVLVILTIVFANISNGEAFAVLTGCLAFHLVIWILSAIIVVGTMRNKANDKCIWFREMPWEKSFYRFIKTRRWKRHLPTYAPKYYDFKSMPHESLLGIISQTEVVHELAALLSLISLLGIRWFGNAPIIATLAAIDFIINLVYVSLQRYNRMRLSELIRSKDTIEGSSTHP